MSLPNYLAKIKSAGVYRFTWDKSVVPPQQAETLRLVVGYSEKGPFNTPVYVESVSDFKSIYGNISKRLERNGAYFHRMAEHALQAGPILALNIKPFNKKKNEDGEIVPEKVDYISFDCSGDSAYTQYVSADKIPSVSIKTLYDTNRFWKLDADKMIDNIKKEDALNGYITLSATDTKDTSCTVFIRKTTPDSYKGITFRTWYATQGMEYPDYMEAILDNDMSDYFAEVYVFRGQFTPSLIERVYKKDADGQNTDEVDYAASGSLARYLVADDTCGAVLNADYTNVMGKKMDALVAMANDPNSNFINTYVGCTLPYFKDANGNYISLDIKFNSDHSKHNMMMKMDETVLEDADVLTDKVVIANDNPVFPIYLKGYTYESIDKKGDTLWAQCKEVLSDPGVYEALTNRVDVEYHYIVDTFDTDSDEGKAELFSIAKDKDNAFAIVNFPKMSKWGKVEGGADAYKAQMPGESEGASFGAYYTQLTFTDGTVKSVIPSAAIVSNNFMQKWGPRQPYYIVAGPNYGALSYSGMVGPDYNFGRSDLDILEPMGVNAIVYVPRLGTYISSNQTAKQVPVSGLSKVHIRELVIYLQNEIEHLLQSYQWELNTQTLRDTIKAKADAICDKIMNNGGIYAFVNICDETNNTPEVIDNEMIILDTEIEPARGAGKMVHQLTIHKTGGLTSSVK